MDRAAAFIRSQQSRSFSKNDILIYQGEEPDVLLAIRKGYVKLHDVSADGSEQVIWIAKKYDIIPLEWLFNDRKHSPFFYTAFTDGEAFLVPKQQFLDLIRHDNEALLGIVGAITAKFADMTRHANATQKLRVRDKLIYMLQFLSERFTPERSGELKVVQVPLTHQDIANLIGATREKTSLELKRLKDEGCIEYDKQAFYIQTAKLAELTNIT